MEKKRLINAIIFTILQFATWAGVFYVWGVMLEEASTQSLFLGAIFPGMFPTAIGVYIDLRISEKENKLNIKIR